MASINFRFKSCTIPRAQLDKLANELRPRVAELLSVPRDAEFRPEDIEWEPDPYQAGTRLKKPFIIEIRTSYGERRHHKIFPHGEGEPGLLDKLKEELCTLDFFKKLGKDNFLVRIRYRFMVERDV